MVRKNTDVPRSSIGGMAPQNYSNKDFVEHLTTHDGTLCTVIWTGEDCNKINRPLFSHQIYDTTQSSATYAHLDHVAAMVQKETHTTRMARGGEHPDRFDIYGLEMPADSTREELVRRCIEHQKAEIMARNATGKTDYYIQKIIGYDSYQTSKAHLRNG